MFPLLTNREKTIMKFINAKPDEIFVGNTKTEIGIPKYLQGLTTARLGKIALDLDGNELDPSYMRPLFINRNEADRYDRIMTARLSTRS